MKWSLLLACVLLGSSEVAAEFPAGVTELCIDDVCIDDVRLDVPASVIGKAAEVVDVIYGDAGIRITWTHNTSGERTSGTCNEQNVRSDMMLVRTRPSGVDAQVLARTSLLSGRAILSHVYYDAVEAYSRSRHIALPVTLGYVMAHEIGHVLLGREHQESGMMRAGWTPHDIGRMRSRRLRFETGECKSLDAAVRRLETAAGALMQGSRQ